MVVWHASIWFIEIKKNKKVFQPRLYPARHEPIGFIPEWSQNWVALHSWSDIHFPNICKGLPKLLTTDKALVSCLITEITRSIVCILWGSELFRTTYFWYFCLFFPSKILKLFLNHKFKLMNIDSYFYLTTKHIAI